MKKRNIVALLMAGLMAASMFSAQAVMAEEPAEETAAEEAAAFDAEAEHGPIFTDLLENGVLKVGIIGNDPTFCYHTAEDGKDVLGGFEVAAMYEMAARLSDYLGREVTVNFYESDFTGCMAALQANQVYFVTRLSVKRPGCSPMYITNPMSAMWPGKMPIHPDLPALLKA